MYKYCLFLRGINVNGIKIKMADLVSFLATLGLEEVQTVLATGNIIVSLEEPIKNLEIFKSDLEKKLSKHYGYEAFLFIRDYKSIKYIVTKADETKIADNYQHYLLILDVPETYKELKSSYEQLTALENESIIDVDKDMFWTIEKGFTLLSEFGKKALGRRYFKSKLTSRNMNTIRKVYQKMC